MERIRIKDEFIESKTGLLFFWEANWVCNKSVIFDSKWQLKKGIYLGQQGNLTTDPPLIPVENSDKVVTVNHPEQDCEIKVFVVRAEETGVYLHPLYEFSGGAWSSPPHEKILKAVKVAKEKTTC